MLFQPSQALLNNWKLWLAKEVVEQWQTQGTGCPNLNNISYDFNLTNNDELIKLLVELSLKVTQSKQTNTSVEGLEQAKTYLEHYYSKNIIERLQQITRSFRNNCIDILKVSASTDLRKASPRELMSFFNSLSLVLTSKKADCEQQRLKYAKKEISAWQAYLKLSSDADNTVKNSLEYSCLTTGMGNALSIYFTSKFKAEAYKAYERTGLDLILLCQSYCERASLSNSMLERIVLSLEQKCVVKLKSIPVFTSLNQIDSNQQRNLIEAWVGHSLGCWENSRYTCQQIESQILLYLEPIAFTLYKDFYHQFIEDSVKRDASYFIENLINTGTEDPW